MSCTVEQLMKKCELALLQNWQYVYGAKGTVLSRERTVCGGLTATRQDVSAVIAAAYHRLRLVLSGDRPNTNRQQ